MRVYCILYNITVQYLRKDARGIQGILSGSKAYETHKITWSTNEYEFQQTILSLQVPRKLEIDYVKFA